MLVFQRVKNWSSSRGISSQDEVMCREKCTDVEYILEEAYLNMRGLNLGGYVLNKLEELTEYIQGQIRKEENDVVDAIADSMIYDMTELLKKGYDPEKVTDEVLKVIESRTGRWDGELGKFVKDKSPQAQARWYKPDYVKNCKLDCPKSYIGSLFEEHSVESRL